MLKKCKYYNNHKTSCSLMIDDLAPIAVVSEGRPSAKDDWGYLMDSDKSLYNYFHHNLLQKYPEIRGTFFIPLESYKYMNKEVGYKIHTRDFDATYIQFLKRISDKFDYAFHGIKHGFYKNINGTEVLHSEFDHLEESDLEEIKVKIEIFQKESGIFFSGGKYPGYTKNKYGEKFIHDFGFKWWCDNAKMANKKHPLNSPIINNNITFLPSNICGDIFNEEISSIYFSDIIKSSLMKIFKRGKRFDPKKYLDWLIEKNLPITIQEHFQNQRTEGKRQTPNVYDDINSLDRIYSILRNRDIWHTNMSDLSNYYDSYYNTEIIEKNNTIEIKYNGNWDKMFLSFASNCKDIRCEISGEIINGARRYNKWIFNNLEQGVYTLL